MKLLHIGLMANGKNEGLSKAFRSACNKYYEVNPGDSALEGKLSQIDFLPDIVFCQIQSEKLQDRDTCDVLGRHLDLMRQKGSYVINWTGDIRYGIPPWMVRFGNHVDLTCFSNERDIKEFGGPSAFLQIGVDAEIFNSTGEPKADREIVFMANHYGNQFPLGGFRKNMTEALKRRYGARFGLYGNFPGADGNYNVQNDDVQYWQGEEAAIYRGCRIAISISNYQVERYTSDRLIRILGCGAFCLAHWYPKIEEEFPEVVTFNTLQELFEKCDYYLQNPKEALKIADKCAERVKLHHTYDAMVRDIFNLVKVAV